MTNNETVFLNSLLIQKKEEFDSSLSDDEFFEIFSFEQILKKYDLSYDELSHGNVDNSLDGGIDGFFFFVNDEMIYEKPDLNLVPKNSNLDLFLIQAKNSSAFPERVFDRVITTVKDIFDFEKPLDSLKGIYSSELLDQANIFRDTYLGIAANHPILNIYFVCSSKGDTHSINIQVKNRAKSLREVIMECFYGSNVEIKYYGARELLDSSRIEKEYTLSLKFEETLSKGDNSYIVLSNLVDYYKFVTDDNGDIRRYIFESNVRDYQGGVEVNKDIKSSLESRDKLDFWWLNNGINILSSNASIVGKTIHLSSVQIVNGLQTTFSIYDYIKENERALDDENRSILIKIIVLDQKLSKTRDRIIKATNFQTAIQSASLRATDQIQHDIEEFFLSNGLYYDRRKNYYKNIGKNANSIVSIQLLSQAFMAIILREPHNARAKPASLIKEDSTYDKIFNTSIQPSVYLFCAKTISKVDLFLRQKSLRGLMNLKFHLAMYCIMKYFGKINYSIPDILSLPDDYLSDSLISESLEEIKQLVNTNGGDLASITKTKDFVNSLQSQFI